MKLEWNERTNETRTRIKKKYIYIYRLNNEGKWKNSRRWDGCVHENYYIIERKEEENKISKD